MRNFQCYRSPIFQLPFFVFAFLLFQASFPTLSTLFKRQSSAFILNVAVFRRITAGISVGGSYTQCSQSVSQETLAKSRIYDLPLLYIFNKQEPWYSSFFEAVKESVVEMKTTVKASIKSTYCSVTHFSEGKRNLLYQLKLLDITSTHSSNTAEMQLQDSLCNLAFLFSEIRFFCLLHSSLYMTWPHSTDLWIRVDYGLNL